MKRLRLGVLGCSNHYFKRVAAGLRESTLVEPWAIASRDKARADSHVASGAFSRAYASYEELLRDPEVDFVYIPLPNHLHLEWIRRAADAGKPILCEKPLALSAAEAQEALAYCAERGVPLMEAFMYRFHPQWLHARRLVDTMELGQVRAVHTVFAYNNRDPRNIRNSLEAGGGALMDIGCYAVSVARWMMGSSVSCAEPERVLALMERDPVFGTDILSSGVLDFGQGRRATFTAATQLFPRQSVEIHGTAGTLALEIPFNMPMDLPARLTVRTDLGLRVVETEICDQYLQEFEAFALAIAAGEGVPTPPEDAVANMAVLDALRASAASGAWAPLAKR